MKLEPINPDEALKELKARAWAEPEKPKTGLALKIAAIVFLVVAAFFAGRMSNSNDKEPATPTQTVQAKPEAPVAAKPKTAVQAQPPEPLTTPPQTVQAKPEAPVAAPVLPVPPAPEPVEAAVEPSRQPVAVKDVKPPVAATPDSPLPQPQKTKVKVMKYTMKDGSVLRVLTSVDGGDTYVVKTEDGKFLTIKKADVEEIKNTD